MNRSFWGIFSVYDLQTFEVWVMLFRVAENAHEWFGIAFVGIR